VSASVARLYRRSSVPQRLHGGALVGYAAVFAGLFVYGRPGIGIGQGFYVPIVLVALAGGPATGAAAGLLATLLYEIALFPDASDGVTQRGGIHLLWYVAAGALVGYFAQRGRALLAEALHTLDDLLRLARRDLDTGTRTAEGLNGVLAERIAAGRPFVLLLGELECDTHHAGLRAATAAIAAGLDGGVEIARVGPAQLAVVPAGSVCAPRREAAALERLLDRSGSRATFGWAAFPGEGDDALSLFRAASERLYARRLVRGEWTPTAASAGLVDELGLPPTAAS